MPDRAAAVGVAALAPGGLGLRETAMPFLEDLYEATHENVQLAVLDALIRRNFLQLC